MNDLRRIIATEPKTTEDGDEQQEEEKKESTSNVTQIAGEDDDGVGGRTYAKIEAEVGSTGNSSTKLMNQYLWGLQGTSLQANCDTSLAPSWDNQVLSSSASIMGYCSRVEDAVVVAVAAVVPAAAVALHFL